MIEMVRFILPRTLLQVLATMLDIAHQLL